MDCSTHRRKINLRVFAPLITMLVFSLASTCVAVEKLQLSLEQALNRGVTQNPELQQQALAAEQTGYQIIKSESDFDFVFNPNIQRSFDEQSESTTYGIQARKKLRWGSELSTGTQYWESDFDGQEDYERGRIFLELKTTPLPPFRKRRNAGSVNASRIPIAPRATRL